MWVRCQEHQDDLKGHRAPPPGSQQRIVRRKEVTRDEPPQIDVIFEVLCTGEGEGTKGVIVLQAILCLPMVLVI